jgi:hypothetical protein
MVISLLGQRLKIFQMIGRVLIVGQRNRTLSRLLNVDRLDQRAHLYRKVRFRPARKLSAGFLI